MPNLIPLDKVVIIGIAGGTASGKSTIASAILESVGVENIIHLLHDSYYKNRDAEGFPKIEGLDTPNFDHPDALETSLMVEHVRRLKNWEAVDIPIYDFVEDRRLKDTRHIEPRPVIMVEGILVLADHHLREMFDIKLFVDTPADIRLIRRLKRDLSERGRTTESVIEQYLNTVRPMHMAFVDPSKLYADVIIPQGGYNTVAIELVADKVRSILAKTDK
jgi:uridine kinase